MKSFGWRAIVELAARTGAGVRKSPGKEPADGWTLSVPRLLWGFGGAACFARGGGEGDGAAFVGVGPGMSWLQWPTGSNYGAANVRSRLIEPSATIAGRRPPVD